MQQVRSVEDLTPEVFTKLVNEKWIQNGGDDEIHVESLSMERVELGVLSQVYRVHLSYNGTSSSSLNVPPTDWLVKLCRTDLNLSWMCRNEAMFYEHLAPRFSTVNAPDDNQKSLPFCVPPFLSGDEHHIILQQILNVETIPLMEGCPKEKIPILLQCLASLHARCWIDPNQSQPDISSNLLISPPGMGQRLHPLQKEGLFVSSWKETVHHMQFDGEEDADTLRFITKLCERLETLKLRDLHDQVHQHVVTLVHGDFHVANCLFQTSTNDTDQKKPVLVDWATAGFGNPMIDFVFFLVVSTNDQVVSESQVYLKRYHQLLVDQKPDLAEKISLDNLQKWFPLALLCQWTILVAYDEVCRHIAGNEPDEQKRAAQFKHFRYVNRRTVLAMKSVANWEAALSVLPPATEQDKATAQEFCNKTALEI